MKHLLIVEDEEHLAIGMKYNFEAEGYDVTTAGDGPTALAKIEDREHPVDLVVLDLMLPGMSGYAVCEKIREGGNDVPILMLSARTLAEDRTRGFDVGTDQYLHKPFDLEELLARVKNLLARQSRRGGIASRGSDELYEFGRAQVNFDTFQVNVAGKSIRLTALEIKLLRYFVEHEGSVVTRNELLEQVWGFSKSPTTRTVDNFVMNLRKYFERDPGAPEHFLSVRGAGYRFVAVAANDAGAERSKSGGSNDVPDAGPSESSRS
ncbi:MAG TPA: response regulator transcription factor [Pirellulales bacterium]|nr:response regulator transcription factor [Pirellulales bacterium]